MKKTLIAALLMTACTSAFASNKNTYDYVDLAYTSVDIKEVDVTYTGVGIDASKLLTENVYVTGQYFSVEDSDTEPGVVYDLNLSLLNVAVGYRSEISAATDVYAQVGYARQKFENDFAFNNQFVTESDSVSGYQVKAGLKHSFGDFEGGLFVERLDGSDDIESTTYIGVDGRYAFTERFHGVVGYSKDSDISIFKLGVSYAF
jgi:hypothetical protein